MPLQKECPRSLTPGALSTAGPIAAGLLPREIMFALCSVTIACALLLAACSDSSGGNSLHLKSPNTGEKDAPIKSSYSFPVTKSFTDLDSKITTAASYRVYTANYDLDAANFAMTLDKPLASEDQVRVVFSLVGDQGTNDKSPPKAGTYSAKADKFMKVEDVAIISRKGAADSKIWLDRSKLTGDVRVSSATTDSLSGEIDLTSGDTSIKGSFTAKVLKRK
jgi:hypothetical protein